MAQKEYERLAKESSGILKQNPTSMSSTTTKSKSRRRSMSKIRSRKHLMQNPSDFNQTCFSNSKISFKETRECCSGDRDKLKDVRPSVKKSRSANKLSCLPAVKKMTKKEKSMPYISHRIKSPLRSSRNARKAELPIPSSRSHDPSTRINEKSHERSTSIKESAPIIINKDEKFQYKAPSLIHETVVDTLRKEKDKL